jgi:hypothetical protein
MLLAMSGTAEAVPFHKTVCKIAFQFSSAPFAKFTGEMSKTSDSALLLRCSGTKSTAAALGNVQYRLLAIPMAE